MKRVLAVRQDNNGDVLLAGPALRAIRNGSDDVVLLCGPGGASVARHLPGVDRHVVWSAAWIEAEPRRLSPPDVRAFVRSISGLRADEAIVFTSFHQSPLPMALLLRMAGIERIGAISVDYGGSLLDVRHHVDENIHEVERALSLAGAMGFVLPEGDGGKLALCDINSIVLDEGAPVVIVHPGSTARARCWDPKLNRALVKVLCERGYRVYVTGSSSEASLTKFVSEGHRLAYDMGGKTTFGEYAALLGAASAVVCGNTVAAHVAAAVGTPVVSIFPPTIPVARFHPWQVPYTTLGDQDAPCAGCRARVCPVEGQPCLSGVTPEIAADAADALIACRRAA